MAKNDVIHKKKTDNQDIVKSIQEKAQATLLDNIQNKAMEVAEYIASEFEDEAKGLTATQVFNVIANRSISDIASITSKTFTPQELGIALNVYIQMMTEINRYIKMPPSKNTFCLLLGISTTTYNSYLQDPEKAEIMNIIETYITGIKLTSAELGELKEISTMFDLKSQHGFVEAQAPITIQHERKLDIDDIRSQLREIKSGRVIEAEYEEKDTE